MPFTIYIKYVENHSCVILNKNWFHCHLALQFTSSLNNIWWTFQCHSIFFYSTICNCFVVLYHTDTLWLTLLAYSCRTLRFSPIFCYYESFKINFSIVGFPCSSAGEESACKEGDLCSIPDWEDPLEKGKATHSSTLAWKIPWAI